MWVDAAISASKASVASNFSASIDAAISSWSRLGMVTLRKGMVIDMVLPEMCIVLIVAQKDY
jgi:hypothetical protein